MSSGATMVRCVKCHKEHRFSDYGLQVLDEDALLVCPSCGAEFNITATLAELPGDEELPPEEEPGEEIPPEEEPGEELPPEEEEPEEEEGRQTESLRVLVCSSCHREWLGPNRNVACPYCESEEVMVSTKAPIEKAAELVDDVRQGILPAARAVAILVGREVR